MIDPSRIQITGALTAHRQGLWDALLTLDYSPLSAVNLLRLTAHLSRWLDEQEVSLKELTHEHIEAFLDARRRIGYVQFRTPRALAPILQYLSDTGVVSLPAPRPREITDLDRLIHDYTGYLLRERGVTVESARAYGDIARRFVREQLGNELSALVELNASDVTAFVLQASSRYSTGTTKYIVTVLRSLLRYLYLGGRLTVDLTGAVPAVSGRHLCGLPKALEPVQVRRLLCACDRRRHIGRRDYAVLLLMVRMGLRSGEVAALGLDDIDWKDGQFRVRGKNQREESMPLPADVGEALARYLRVSRPQSHTRQVFLGVRAPHRPLHSIAVRAIVCRALARAGLPGTNAHRLRHTAATQMLRAGACLDEIAQVLRHRCHSTTAIYAKVDRVALHAVTRPWPGERS